MLSKATSQHKESRLTEEMQDHEDIPTLTSAHGVSCILFMMLAQFNFLMEPSGFLTQKILLKAAIKHKRPEIIKLLLTMRAEVDISIFREVIVESENK